MIIDYIDYYCKLGKIHKDECIKSSYYKNDSHLLQNTIKKLKIIDEWIKNDKVLKNQYNEIYQKCMLT